jgi:hypothetical protein
MSPVDDSTPQAPCDLSSKAAHAAQRHGCGVLAVIPHDFSFLARGNGTLFAFWSSGH